MSLAYDIIGDIHGCADKLEKLLQKLGYDKSHGVYSHPCRQAVFLGDIIDRGPKIREALHLVKNMVDVGHALCVMGNHEYNALIYCMADKSKARDAFIRGYHRLLASTLAAFKDYPREWSMFLDWFASLPVFLDLGVCRVVHACWDTALIERYQHLHGGSQVTSDFLLASCDPQTFAGHFMNRLTRGITLPLPKGRYIYDNTMHKRRLFRTKFWIEHPKTYGDIAFQPEPLPIDILDHPLGAEEKSRLLYYSQAELPLFVGHYWLRGRPEPLRTNLACLDYCAVKRGALAAYRFDGEASLSAEKFVWV